MQKSKKNRKIESTEFGTWESNSRNKKKKLINYVFKSKLWESFLNIEIYKEE